MQNAILINRASGVALHRQLEAALRAAILSGRLAPNERILSSREWQTHLGLSRNTVVDALGQLHAEGYLVTVRGVGTFVAPHVHRVAHASGHEGRASEVIPSQSAARFVETRALAGNLPTIAPFRPGLPALDLFPAVQFKRAFNTADWSARLMDYPDPLGHEPLRAAIARRLRQTRGIVCSADDIFVTGGAQASFSLIARVLLNANDRAVMEEPGYPNIRAIFLAHGAHIVAAPVDRFGIDVASFQKVRAKLAYVTPSHQYPTGAVLSLERRLALLDWAEKMGAWIIEDDYDSEFNYTDRPQPALQGLGGGGRVIYVGTFSKVLSPALRIAYVIVPRALRAAFAAGQQVTSGAPDALVQAALARFMDAGHLSRHITKMRKVYDERRRFASSAFAQAAGEAFGVRDSRAGLHFIVELPKSVRDTAFSARALSLGVIAPALSAYFFNKPALNGVVIGYAGASIPEASKAIQALTGLL